MYKTECSICHQVFEHRFPKQHVCEKCKNRPCEVCGKPFKRVDPYDQKCCSKECRKVLINDAERNKQLTAQRKATLRAKYGVENVSQLPEVKDKISAYMRDPKAYSKSVPIVIKPKLIRQCIICGQEFEATGSQTTCKNKHYRECIVCGKKFEFKHLSDSKKTCSRECTSKLRDDSLQLIEKTCEYCGKKFQTKWANARFCSNAHYRVCPICNKRYQIDLTNGLDNIPRTCSIECKKQLTAQTNMRRYGYSSYQQTPQSRARAKLQSIENAEQRRQTCLERYGVENVAQSDEVREKLSKSISSMSVQTQMQNTMQERYGVNFAMQSRELASKHSGTQFAQHADDGTRVDSSWEQIVYNFLLRNNIKFEYNTHKIEYEYDGKMHTTFIDFKIGDLLLEVKGTHLLNGAYSDADGVVPISRKLEIYRDNHVIIVTGKSCSSLFGKASSTESNGLKYLNKCPNPLIGVDIDLFSNPQFSFAKDRPECFYKVRVDGKPSSLDAFFDESVRWKMILNRINYSGGFIDNKQVLTAMNVTRTCKQPSWFAQSLAERLIQTYCSSNTIFDPFAGWGTRYDAALKLGRKYIGGDLNPELVEWHNKQGRHIQLADAKEFKTDEICSVLICPPYSDPKTGRCFEDYNFEQFDESAKALSQCDWLKIVIENAPNAREYVMVCKIVDEGFEKFVKEIITNKSHLGTNNEFVLVLKQAEAKQLISHLK